MLRRTLLSFLLFALSCAPATPTPRSTPASAGSLTPPATAQRVVLVSFDGLGADLLARQGTLAGFGALVKDGLSARVITTNPTVTSSTHVTILTGADPQRHGIVSNRFHVPGTPADQATQGFNADIDVETIVEAARRQGKTVGSVLFPTLDARTAQRRADFGLVWNTPSVASRTIQLSRRDFKREWVPPTWTPRPGRRVSFSPIMRSRVEWRATASTRADVDVVAYDTTDDGRENYDAYFVEVDSEEVPSDPNGWFAVSRTSPEGMWGSWSKFMSSTPSLDVTIYWGAISRTIAYPEAFRALVEREAGFWPGSPDEEADIDEVTFEQQMERLASFATRAQTAAIENMPFDLLLAYQPQVDTAGHNFLGYDDDVIRRAILSSDRAVTEIRSRLDLTRDALVVVGDHGAVPVERLLRLNRLLADLGFAPRWRAFTSGSVAHLYRFEGPDDADQLIAALRATGHFERIERKAAAAHRHSGDVIAFAFPSIGLSASSSAPALTEPDSYGHHGALNTHRELHTVMFAVGRGVKPGPAGEIAQTRIARYVSELLGITPPAAAE